MRTSVDLIELTWLDAEGQEHGGGWVEDGELNNDKPIFKTYGLYVGSTELWVYYADTYDPYNGNWGGRARIPRGMILSTRVLETIYYDPEVINNT